MNPKNIIWIFVMLLSCVPDTNHDTTDKKAASDEVSEFIESFEGRGDLTDETQSTPPKEAVSLFKHPDDLAIDLVLAEPEIFQPVEIKFDRHGRLWVVQYSQYPYPEGLKITSVDNHLRVQFDKVPEAPPAGVTGADKITFFEDTNGDGVFDKSTTAISGLNIATSVLTGSGRIWVLNPPYLLAYPDHDDNGIPDGDPEVHLQGFGLEDTHAVANNLRWGPDGWIYGAQGSTTTADVSSAVTKHIRFQGQAIWRYHPERKTFEIFAEGGGNTFDVELDEKGRLYSGDNGNDRGQYYKQGAYYVKNWGKHGPHTNPYSFGYLPNMALEGDKKRFTHAWIKYEENRLPLRYRNKMLAINPLQSYIQMTRLEPNGSTFRNFDEERILETPDHWFRPVDIKAGPDGAVYLADWYDSRLSHVDPRDTWDKKSGRVYRLRDAQSTPGGHQVDLAKWSDEELISGLSSDQKWIRQQVQRILADRKDPHYIQLLTPLLKNENGQIALEALWGLNACGAFDATLSLKTLQHTDPFVRMWSVRLIGDQMSITQEQGKALVQMAISEMHPEVRSQLAATAKRIDYHYTSQIIKALLSHKEDDIDPDIPLQTWWAIEAKILTHPSIGSEIFAAPDVWMSPTAQHTILSRLGQRLVAGNTEECYHTLDVLLQQAPKHQLAKPLVTGILEGLRGRDLQSLPATLYATLQSYSDVMEEGAHAFGIRKGEENHMSEAAKVVQDPDADIQERLSYIKIFGDIIYPPVVESLIAILNNSQTPVSLKQAALVTLKNYSNDEIGEKVASAYPDRLRADPEVRLSALSLLTSRPIWTQSLLKLVADTRQIHKEDIPSYLVMQMKLSEDPEVSQRVKSIWPELENADETGKEKQYLNTLALINKGSGNAETGKKIFETYCSSCHRLGPMGKDIGPDLSGYDRRNTKDLLYNIIYPNADIREGYVNYLVNLEGGTTVMGSILANEGSNIVIRAASGETVTLPESKIKSMEALEKSLMPEGLLSNLSEKEIQDLFSFLAQEP